VEEVGQGGEDLGREPSKLFPVGEGQLAKKGLALRADLDQDLPLVQLMAEPPEQSDRDHAVDELPDRVVLELELPRQGPDGGKAVLGQPLDGQKELMLPGPEPGGARGLLAERVEAPDQVPEAREGAVVRIGRRNGGRGHLLKNIS